MLINPEHPLYQIGHTRGVLCANQAKPATLARDKWHEAIEAEENSRHFASHVGFHRLTQLEWAIYNSGVYDGIESVLGTLQWDELSTL